LIDSKMKTMDLGAEKLNLIQWLAQLSDEKIISKIKAIRNEKANSTLTSVHKNIIEERLISHEESPESGSSWQEAKQRIASK